MMITRRRLLTSSALLAGGALLTSPFTSRRGHAADSYPRRVVIFIEGNGIRPECVMDPLTRQTLESIAGKPIASNRDYGHADPVITAKAPLDQARSLGALAAQGQELSLVERSALVLGLSATQVGGGHSSNFGALSASKALGGAPSATIDAVLAAIPEVRAMTPFDAIRVGAATRLHPVQLQLVRVRQGQAGADPPPALGGLLYLLRRRRLGRRRRVLPDAQALPRVRPRGRRPRAQGLQRLLQGPHQALRLP
jgi:hypothetical protein